jgi:hypothetical protein
MASAMGLTLVPVESDPICAVGVGDEIGLIMMAYSKAGGSFGVAASIIRSLVSHLSGGIA